MSKIGELAEKAYKENINDVEAIEKIDYVFDNVNLYSLIVLLVEKNIITEEDIKKLNDEDRLCCIAEMLLQKMLKEDN